MGRGDTVVDGFLEALELALRGRVASVRGDLVEPGAEGLSVDRPGRGPGRLTDGLRSPRGGAQQTGDFSREAPGMKPASVVVPLYVDTEGPGVLFLRRTEGAVPHSGQIAFPGGRREPGEDELACALREAREEVGIAPEHLEVIGSLDRYATITDYLISPFVARVRSWPLPLVADPVEVAAILPVPVARLLAPGTLKAATRETPAGPRVVNFFEVGDEVIWGATAAMLRQLLELAVGPLSPRGEVPWDKVRW